MTITRRKEGWECDGAGNSDGGWLWTPNDMEGLGTTQEVIPGQDLHVAYLYSS
jgi:hypothetical protein